LLRSVLLGCFVHLAGDGVAEFLPAGLELRQPFPFQSVDEPLVVDAELCRRREVGPGPVVGPDLEVEQVTA
jgi:hypothetical protein